MTVPNETPEVLSNGDSGPAISRLTRRQFLASAGAAIGTVGAASLLGCGRASRNSMESSFTLPDMPNPNPAYQGCLSRDGGLLLFTRTKTRQLLAYGMNANGRAIWALCDGARTPAIIASEYRKHSGRIEAEATEFLSELMKLGVVVAGLHIVPVGRFPKPPKGRCYHAQTTPQQHNESR